MIQPRRRVTSTTATNPPISGQYMAGTLHPGLKGRLASDRAQHHPLTPRRAGRPARWRWGMPTRPAADALVGTRTGVGWVAADPPDDWAGRSRRDLSSTPHRAGSDGR